MIPDAEVRAAVLSELGPAAVARVPRRAWRVVPLVLGIGLAGYLSLVSVWPVALVASGVAGVLYGSLFFLGHEISHGGAVGPGRLRVALSWLCFQIFLLSPHLWVIWHQKVHHGHTNVRRRDPDIYGTLEDIEALPARGFVMAVAPGSGRLLSALYPFLWFFGQGQAVLWSTSRWLPGFEALDRRRAATESALMLLPWVAVLLIAGPRAFLMLFLLPFFVANATVMLFILTNHLAAPLGAGNSTLTTTWSVTCPAWLDVLLHNFSHHVEHHLFPTAPSSAFPAVRAVLRRRYAAHYVCPAFLVAVRAVYRTPRAYGADGASLADPVTGHSVSLPLPEGRPSTSLDAYAPAIAD